MQSSPAVGSTRRSTPLGIVVPAKRSGRGSLALLLAVLLAAPGCFFLSGPRPDQMHPSSELTAGSPEFLLAVSGTLNAPLRRGGHAELLVNGVEFVPALLESIDGAERSVHFTTYVWEPGRLSDLILDALERAAARGVDVRLLLDGHGARNLDPEALEGLERAGASVATFRPLGLGWLSRAHKRNHRRAIVIDGETGFTGGAGVADVWLGDAGSPEQWRDDLVKVSGELARSLQAAFTELWVQTTGEVPTGTSVHPLRPRTDPDPEAEPVTLHVSVASSPSSEHTPLRTLFWLSFAGARERIWISNPYVVPAPSLRDVLCDRAREGVDVRILTAGDHSDIAVVRWATRHHYDQLLDAGVRIFEYQPTLIHSKSLVVDGVWSLVGSANLDFRSSELNEENVLAIRDTRFAARLEEVFLADLRNAREIDAEHWARRGPFARARELMGFLMEEQL